MLARTFSGTPPTILAPPGMVDTQMHMYLPGYPAAPGAIALPVNAPGPDEYRQVMQWLGIERVVITQGNAHGLDNANLLACLAEMGPVARGVAVIDASTSAQEMVRLRDGGVVGARIMDLPGGAVGLDQLEAVDARTRNAGWCLAIQFDGSDILQHKDRLARVESRWILDHHGKFFAGVTPDGPEVDAVKRLLDSGRCWFKFAGCYESSRVGAPGYDDVAALARVFARYAPERIIWGTNWPHNLMRQTADYPNDAALFDTVSSWLPDQAARTRCLTVNAASLFFGE